MAYFQRADLSGAPTCTHMGIMRGATAFGPLIDEVN
jgi:hypothetical protein